MRHVVWASRTCPSRFNRKHEKAEPAKAGDAKLWVKTASSQSFARYSISCLACEAVLISTSYRMYSSRTVAGETGGDKETSMNKTITRFMGIIVAIALALGGFTKAEATSSEPAVAGKPVYVYYYLWWSSLHWKNKLGANYPYSASPLPLPATTDADGCNAVSSYTGNQLLDVPTRLVSQDEPGAIEADIRTAKSAGITGFWLNWNGNGSASQTRTSVTYTPRLAEAFA